MNIYAIVGIGYYSPNTIRTKFKTKVHIVDYEKLGEELIGKYGNTFWSRKREFVVMRQCISYLLHVKYKAGSMVSIGNGFMRMGRASAYDHTSILHSIQTIEDYKSIKDEYVVSMLEEADNIVSIHVNKI